MSFFKVKKLNIENSLTKEILLQDINFELEKNQILGIIGESGSGKSLLCRTILGLLPSNLKIKGNINLQNCELLNNEKDIRKNFSVVLQEAIQAFNPLYSIQEHMIESFKYKLSKKEAIKKSTYYLEQVGLKDTTKILKSYANELSGGQLQRVMIAIALLQDTNIIVADEPTSSLDTINQKQIIEIFKNFENKTIIFVSHDLGVISDIAHKILVLKDGKIVEQGEKNSIFNKSSHPYTKFLLNCAQNLSKDFTLCLQ